MKKPILFVMFSLILTTTVVIGQESFLKLWYDRPATQWVEALPIGNGRLGAMVFGDPCNEIIQLNENTVWAGQPNRNDNPEAKAALPEVRELIFEGKYKEAQNLVDEKFISKTSHGMPYQTVGNLELFFPGHENYSDYYRELDLEKALTTSRYRVNGINYTTEVFASYPDQVIIVRIFGDKTGVVNFSATMTRPSKSNITTKGNDELVLSGITSDHETVKGAVQFATHIKILTHGGSTSTSESSLHVFDADTATIYISIASNFVNYSDISGNAFERASAYLQHALKKDYKQIIDDHIKDYRQYFKRVNLNLGTTDAIKNPIDVRLQQFSGGNDPQMVALYFQFGRYLLISSSRPGGQPANLQGIWNDELFPPWDSKYTVNINTEMNIWPSEVTNLTDMNEP